MTIKIRWLANQLVNLDGHLPLLMHGKRFLPTILMVLLMLTSLVNLEELSNLEQTNIRYDTNVNQDINADETWIASNSPYYVTNDIVVNHGVT